MRKNNGNNKNNRGKQQRKPKRYNKNGIEIRGERPPRKLRRREPDEG